MNLRIPHVTRNLTDTNSWSPKEVRRMLVVNHEAKISVIIGRELEPPIFVIGGAHVFDVRRSDVECLHCHGVGVEWFLADMDDLAIELMKAGAMYAFHDILLEHGRSVCQRCEGTGKSLALVIGLMGYETIYSDFEWHSVSAEILRDTLTIRRIAVF